MAIYHCHAKGISRAAGRTATAAAAYRAGEKIRDERTGETHDYTRKAGVVHQQVLTPDASLLVSRADLWNMAEAAEVRKDAKVAREWEVSLPAELTPVERRKLAEEFARHLVDKYGVAADLTIHAPDGRKDDRNHHAHVLVTTRKFDADKLELTDKTRELDSPKTSGQEVAAVRLAWSEMANRALERAGHETRIDPRSLEAQGINRRPTTHLGPVAAAMERRGAPSRRGEINRARAELDRELDRTMQERQQLEAELRAELSKAADTPPPAGHMPPEAPKKPLDAPEAKKPGHGQGQPAKTQEQAMQAMEAWKKRVDQIIKDGNGIDVRRLLEMLEKTTSPEWQAANKKNLDNIKQIADKRQRNEPPDTPLKYEPLLEPPPGAAKKPEKEKPAPEQASKQKRRGPGLGR